MVWLPLFIPFQWHSIRTPGWFGYERLSSVLILRRYIIYGPTPKNVLDKYTILTGKPGKVPSWSFGLWLSTSFTTNYDEATVNSFLEGMNARDIPVEVFHYDCFWLRAFHWCDFVFDSEKFPDPKAQISRLKSAGDFSLTSDTVFRHGFLG